jgi:hypothetical protein
MSLLGQWMVGEIPAKPLKIYSRELKRHERAEDKARRGLTTAAYMEIREDCGVARRSDRPAQ